MVNLFFSPQGRIGKGPFWIGVIVLLVVGLALSAAQAYAPQSLALVFGLLSFVLIYPSVCVYVKRFHDAGKSGWWYLLVILLSVIVAGAASFFLFAPYFSELQEMAPNSPEMQARTQQITEEIFLPSQGVGVAISLVIAFIVSMLPSDPGENRFGPPTSAAGTAATFQ